MCFFQQFHRILKYTKGNTNKLEDMLSRPPKPNITTWILLCIWSLSPIMHTKRSTWKMRTSRRYFSSYKAKFMLKKVISRLSIISRLGFSTSWIFFLFLKDKYYNLSNRLTPQKLRRILMLGKQCQLTKVFLLSQSERRYSMVYQRMFMFLYQQTE
jgi:hypothetical protein